MIETIERQRDHIAALCREYGVHKLELFGSAMHPGVFEHARSDIDFLVTFDRTVRNDLDRFLAFQSALSDLVGTGVDLVEREEIEQSRNYLRRREILARTEPVYG